MCNLTDTQEEKDPTQLQSTHGVPCWLGDGLQRASFSYCLRQVRHLTIEGWQRGLNTCNKLNLKWSFSSNASPSEGTPVLGNIGCTPQSLPKFQHPSHELLKDNGFTQHVYHKYRRRCLNGTNILHFYLNSVMIHLIIFPSTWSCNFKQLCLPWHQTQSENDLESANHRRWTRSSAFGRFSSVITSTGRCTRSSGSWLLRMEKKATGESPDKCYLQIMLSCI